MLCNIKLNFIFLVIIDLNYCFPKELPKINKRINSDSFEKQITQLKKKKKLKKAPIGLVIFCT